MRVDAFGTASTVWVEDTANNDQLSPDCVNSQGNRETGFLTFQLNAGDVLGYDQNSGTNATVDGSWRITESPV